MDSKMFPATNVPLILNLFHQADVDGSGSLNIEEFCDGLKEIFQTDNKEELINLFYKIDTNCDGQLDLGELVEFLICRKEASKSLIPKDLFPMSIKVTTMNHYKTIAEVIFIPFIDSKASEAEVSVQTRETRTYQTGQYVAISSDGILTYLSDRMTITSRIKLDKKEKALPFSSNTKWHVTGMAYIKELKQMAVSTSEKEVLFYSCNEMAELFLISHALILDDSPASAIICGSNNNKSVLAFGDVEGFLTVLTAHNIQGKGSFFSEKVFEKTSLRYYKTVYVSTLLKNKTGNCRCLKISIFNDICTQIRYFPSVDSLAICSSSSTKMVIVTLPNTHKARLHKDIFESAKDKQFFNCVDYSPLTGFLLTGGKDGLLREWFHFSTKSCIRSLAGHVKPITHIAVNSKDKLVISLSEDKNVRVWSEEKMLPLQSFQVQDMGNGHITSMSCNTYNNELVLANTQIGACLGKGTDVYQKTLKSHDMPICGALYHKIYKQVISVCQTGVVKVWDILTGDAIVRFNVTSDQHVGHTAIAFDEPQRRLITGSPDGKVRLWNFSNGKCLAVHRVTLPNTVTGLVCFNERLFVSVKNSKIIYDLDLEAKDNRFLKHDYLSDISSMDVHKSTLISASSNGNIVIWNIQTEEFLFWINGSKSAKTVWMGKRNQGQTGPIEKLTKESGCTSLVKARHIIKSLKTREVSASTATLLSAADGYICAWSAHAKGGLLGKFKAVDEEGAVITTMTTDANEGVLLAGDSNGKMYQWDIHQFGFAEQSNEGPYGEQNGWRWSLAPPPLLASWQCSTNDVVSFVSDNSCKKLITAGLDCYLRLWENTGSHIGVFGRNRWNAKQLNLETHWDEENERLAITSTRKTKKSKDNSKLSQSKVDLPKIDHTKLSEQPDNVASPYPGLEKKEMKARVETPVNLLSPPFDFEKFLYNARSKPSKEKDNAVRWVPVFNSKGVPSPPTSEEMHLKLLPPPTQTTIRYGRDLKTSKLRSCLKNDLPSNQKRNTTSEHVRLLPKRVSVDPGNHQIQLHPQPPHTEHVSDRARPGFDQTQVNPLQTPTLNHISSKYGRVVKIQQGDASNKSVLKPCPPRPQRGHDRIQPTPHHTSESISVPPIGQTVEPRHPRIQHPPHPPHTSGYAQPIHGGAQSRCDPSLIRPKHTQTLSNYISSKCGPGVKIQHRDASRNSVLKPCPPSTQPGHQGKLTPHTPQTLEHVSFPPIHERTHSGWDQTRIKPLPIHTLNNINSKYERIMKGDTLKKGVLKPCPPSTQPGHHQAKLTPHPLHTSEGVRLTPISDWAQPGHHPTQMNQQPPHFKPH